MLTHLGPPSRWQRVTFDCSLPLPPKVGVVGLLPLPLSVTSLAVMPLGVSHSLA